MRGSRWRRSPSCARRTRPPPPRRGPRAVVHQGTTVAEALGNGHVAGVRIAAITGQGEYERNGRVIECDCVVTSVGYAPAGNLIWYAGGRFAYDEDTAMHRVFELPQGVVPAGSVNGVGTSTRCWPMAGAPAGTRRFWGAPRASRRRRRDALKVRSPPVANLPPPAGQGLRRFRRGPGVKDIRHAVLDGYDDVQLLKRYSTLGMGPSQGRHSSVAAIRLLAEATGRASRRSARPRRGLYARGEVRAPRRARLRPRAPTAMHPAPGAGRG